MKIFSVQFFLVVFLLADFFIPLFLVFFGHTIAESDNLLGSLSIVDLNINFLSYSLLFIVSFFFAYSLRSPLHCLTRFWSYFAKKFSIRARRLQCRRSFFVAIIMLTVINFLAFLIVSLHFSDALSLFFRLRLNVANATELVIISKYKTFQLAINTSLVLAVFSYVNAGSSISPINLGRRLHSVIFLCIINTALLSCVQASRGAALFTILSYFVCVKWSSIKGLVLSNRKVLLLLVIVLPLGLWLFALLSSIRHYLQYQDEEITFFSINMLFNAFEGHSLRASNMLITHCVEFELECSRNGTYLANLSMLLKPLVNQVYAYNGLFIPNDLLGLPHTTLPAYSVISLSYLNFGIPGMIESLMYGFIAKYLDTYVKNAFPGVYVAIVLPSVPVFYWMGLISFLSVLMNLVLALVILSTIRILTPRLKWRKSI